MDDAWDGVDKGSDRWLRDCELSTGPGTRHENILLSLQFLEKVTNQCQFLSVGCSKSLIYETACVFKLTTELNWTPK